MSSEGSFRKPVLTLQQLITQRRKHLPFLVNTIHKLDIFDEKVTVDAGKPLFLEGEVDVEFVKVKVLDFHDAENELSKRGAEFMDLYGEFNGKEFYMPLNCPGKFKFVPYPGLSQNFERVSQIIENLPRYIKAKDDITAIPPRGIPDNCLQSIPAGTVIEPKEVVYSRNSWYLKCLDARKGCYFLRQDCTADFIGISDEHVYSMPDLKKYLIPLPKVIQFIPGTVTPNDVVLFNDEMARNNLIITGAPLQITEIKRRKMVVAKARHRDQKCFITLLLPRLLCDKVRVEVTEFESPDLLSNYLQQKFGGCRGDNTFIHSKMYIMPLEDDFICHLQSEAHRSRAEEFQDSSDLEVDIDYETPYVNDDPTRTTSREHLDSTEADCDYVDPNRHVDFPCEDESYLQSDEDWTDPESDWDYDEPEETAVLSKEAPPIPSKKFYQNGKTKTSTDDFLPQRVINDKDVLQKLKDKARLGFDKVHNELKRAADKFRQQKSKDKKSLDTDRTGTESSTNWKRPLSLLSSSVKSGSLTDSASVIDDDMLDKDNYDQIHIGEEKGKSKRRNPMKRLQLKIGSAVHNERKPDRRSHSVATFSTHCGAFSPIPKSAPILLSHSDEHGAAGIVAGVEEKRQSLYGNTEFCTFSISQTVECFRLCGMDNLANVCEEQKLDGNFFKPFDVEELKDLFELSSLQTIKLKKIFDGWRPKFD